MKAMEEREVDVAVLGSGTAGLGAYRAAKAKGCSAMLIDGGPYGTTCARVGCMPSKLLLAAAEACHDIHRASALGIRVDGSVVIDGKAVMGRVRRERDRFVGGVLRSIDEIPIADRLAGYGRFVAPGQLEVFRQRESQGGVIARVAARSVVIATGSSPAIPGPFRAFGPRLIVNDDVFEWEDLPRSVAVFGPGVIGLELGQALHRLGVRVRVFGIGNVVGPLTDPDVAAVTRKVFGEELYLDADAKITEMTAEAEGAVIGFIDRDGTPRREHFDHVLAATGRRPNVIGIGLENAGILLDEWGVPVFDRATMQCGGSSVFIAGDASNDRPLLHEAADEGRIAGANAATFPDIIPGARRAPLAVVFSDPQIATIGESYGRLVAARGEPGTEWIVGEVSFEDQGRSRVMLKNQGLMRLYAECRTGRLLGGEMVGPRMEHMGHLLAWAVQQQMTVEGMLSMPFYHPVVEEGLRTALRDAAAKLSAVATRAAERGMWTSPAPLPR